MELIRINDAEYLYGIKWSSIVPRNEINKKFSQLIKTQKTKFGIVCNYKNNAVIGLLENTTKKPKQLSAAAYLANANGLEYTHNLQEGQDDKGLAWICVQKTDIGKYWIGNSLNGLPFEEDVVVDSYDIKVIVGNLLTNIKLESPNSITTIFVGDEDINISLSKEFNSEENVSFSSKSFDDIIKNVKYQAQIKEKATIVTLLAPLIIVGLICGVGYYGYNMWEQMSIEDEERMSEEARQERREKLEATQKEYEAKKIEAIQIAKEKIKQKVNEQLTSGTEYSIINNWYETLSKENPIIRGWAKTDINCGINDKTNKTFCNVNLVRSNSNVIGTVKNIKDYYASKGISDVVVDEKGDKILVKYLSDNSLDIKNGDYTYLNDFDYEEFKYKTISHLQLLELNTITKEIEAPSLISMKVELPQAPEGIKQDLNFEEINLGISQGEVILRGTELYGLKSLANNLSKLEKPLYIKSIELKANPDSSNYSWIVKGKYFVEDKEHKGGNADQIKIPKSEIIYK